METYSNPVLCGFYPDPSICRVGPDYYLVNSTFAYFPGIPVFHSTDLVHWNLLGHVLDRNEQIELSGLGVSKGIFAPSVRYHDGLFYVTCTVVDGKGNFIVTAKDPAGPWSDPVYLPDVFGIDPSLFFDDLNCWLIYNSVAPDNHPLYNGHRTIRMKQFDPQKLCTTGNEIMIINGGTDLSILPRWIEGPHMFRRNGFYYLIAAEGGTGYDHSVVVFRSKNVTGPFEPYIQNPILTHRNLLSKKFPVTSTGHADITDSISGDWYAVLLACRPYEGDHYNTGRETFLVPVTWKEDWPLLNEGFDHVQYHYPLPLHKTVSHQHPYNGNFSIRDNFDSADLHGDWMFLRNPKKNWYHIEHGRLIMLLQPETCAGFENPSLIARRQQHLRCVVTCSMYFLTSRQNEKAGLVIFQDQDHFYFLCVSASADGHTVIELHQSVLVPADESRMHMVVQEKITVNNNEIRLKISCDHEFYSFYFSTGTNEWQLIKDKADAKFLSTATAGGFVGCTFGMYATSLGLQSDNIVFFDWFEYEGNDEVYRRQY